MIAPRDVERARTRWDVISADVALQRRGRELYGLCPFHVERTPSFSVAPEKGFFHCFGCGAHGDAIDYVRLTRRLDFAGAVALLAGLTAQHAKCAAPTPRRTSKPAVDTAPLVGEVLAGCEPLGTRSAAALYLWSRGLSGANSPGGLNPYPSLLAHPALPYHHEGERGVYPALILPVTASDGSITALQRIWVVDRVELRRGDEDARAPVAVRKKSLGHFGDGAVRLAPPGPILGFAEGVETALAVMKLFRFPCWALCGTARMGHGARPPSFWIPPEVDTVMMFGDNGAAGHAAASHAADALRRRGIRAGAHFPDRGYGDFNDQLLGRAA